jgi:hypothetical protein
MGNKNENIHLFILEKLREGNLTEPATKNIFSQTVEYSTNPIQIDESGAAITIPNGQDPVEFLQELNKKAKNLLNEKAELTRTKEMLRQRIAQQIETKKRRIENYKTEIALLKQKCQVLQAALEAPFPNN